LPSRSVPVGFLYITLFMCEVYVEKSVEEGAYMICEAAFKKNS
jgi:hypothetical protein